HHIRIAALDRQAVCVTVEGVVRSPGVQLGPCLATVAGLHQTALLDAHEKRVRLAWVKSDVLDVWSTGWSAELPLLHARNLVQGRYFVPGLAEVRASEQRGWQRADVHHRPGATLVNGHRKHVVNAQTVGAKLPCAALVGARIQTMPGYPGED